MSDAKSRFLDFMMNTVLTTITRWVIFHFKFVFVVF